MATKSKSHSLNGAGEALDATAFVRKKFCWLRQVACDAELSWFAVRVAILLVDYFSQKRHGVAWPSQITLAKKLGTRRQRINEAILELVARGHLSSQRRSGHSNLYHLALKEAARPTPGDARPDVQGDARPGVQGVHATACIESFERTQAAYKAAPGESESGASAAAGRAGASSGSARPPGEGEKEGEWSKEKDGDRQGGDRLGNGSDPAGRSNGRCCSDAQLDALREAWRRDAHVATDGKRIAIAAQRKALTDALGTGALFENILAAAKRCAEAFDADGDGRRYLPPLQDWLAAKGWESKPPSRQQRRAGRRGNGGSHRKANGKAAYTNPFYKRAGYEQRGPAGRMWKKEGVQ
jgi:hypothetical protein